MLSILKFELPLPRFVNFQIDSPDFSPQAGGIPGLQKNLGKSNLLSKFIDPCAAVISQRAAAGRAQLLAKKGHTGHVQNPVKVSENRPACGTAQHTLAVCFVFEKLEKSRKFLVKIWRKFSKILAKFWQFLRKFRKNQQKFQQFLTKILRLKNGAKECIV